MSPRILAYALTTCLLQLVAGFCIGSGIIAIVCYFATDVVFPWHFHMAAWACGVGSQIWAYNSFLEFTDAIRTSADGN